MNQAQCSTTGVACFEYGDHISPATPAMAETFGPWVDGVCRWTDNQHRLGAIVEESAMTAATIAETAGVTEDNAIYLFAWDDRGQFLGCRRFDLGEEKSARGFLVDLAAEHLDARDIVTLRRSFTDDPRINEHDISLLNALESRAEQLRNMGTDLERHDVYAVDVLAVGHGGTFRSVRGFLRQVMEGAGHD